MKLYQRLEWLSYHFRYEATYLEMKYHLKRVLKGKELDYIKKIHHYDRNIGKSCALARLSVKYNIPIVVPTKTYADFITKDIPQYIPRYFKNKHPQTIIADDSLRGKRFNIILVEECIPDETMHYVIMPMVKKSIVGYENVEIR